jgi:hypothetical protein
MPVILKSMDEVAELGSRVMKWVCVECRALNLPGKIHCSNCDKQRWSQLGWSERLAARTAKYVAEQRENGY